MSDGEEDTPGSKSDPLRTGVGLEHRSRDFPMTEWTLLAPVESSEESARNAYVTLCESYWYPLYSFLRRRGYQSSEAQDLTQGFFAYLLKGDRLGRADRGKGKFRSFLLGCLKNYLSDVRRSERAAKRGGGEVIISIDEETAEQRYSNEPVDTGATPEEHFDRQWALGLFARTLDDLKTHYHRKGKARQFELLRGWLTAEAEQGDYKKVSELLGKSEANVRSAVRHLRARFSKRLRTLISQTVSDSSSVEEELRYLMEALR